MKSSTVLGLFVCVLGIAFVDASVAPEVFTEKLAASAQPNTISMRTSSVYAQCNDILQANINSVLGVYREYTNACAVDAENKRNNNNNNNDIGGGSRRVRVENLITSVMSYFKDCASKNGIFFHVCLAEQVDEVINYLFNIKNLVETALTNDGSDENSQPGISTNIDVEERTCLANALDYYREENERHISLFAVCINSGANYYN